MLSKLFNTGTIGPLQPKSSKLTTILLVWAASVFATTTGYDSALMSGLNIMPSYTAFLQLTTATKSLNVSANFIGWGIASLTMGYVVDKIGRKSGVVLSIVLKLVGVALISGAMNVGMFVCGRIVLGLGSGTAGIAGSTWLAETLPPKVRGLGLSLTFSVFYVGALISAGVTYGTASIQGEWSWRLPCLLQSIFSFASALCLFCVPESPRWLVFHNRADDALTVLASILADGDHSDPAVLLQHKDITDTLNWERSKGKKLSFAEMVKTPTARKRVMLAASAAVIAMSSGNNIVSFFLGDMLDDAGITNTTTQLEINIIINAWCLVCSMVGTFCMDRVGRKTLCLVACVGMTVTLFLIGGLTKAYSGSGNNSGIYGTVASIFLFMGSYSVGITPITALYPPEVLNYSIRSNGMALWAFFIAVMSTFTTLVFPIALEAISWKLYFVVGAWDFLQTLFVRFFWIETKGLSLEELDKLIEGKEPSDVPDLETLQRLDGMDIKDPVAQEIEQVGIDDRKLSEQ